MTPDRLYLLHKKHVFDRYGKRDKRHLTASEIVEHVHDRAIQRTFGKRPASPRPKPKARTKPKTQPKSARDIIGVVRGRRKSSRRSVI
jgi:hypothetical protein